LRSSLYLKDLVMPASPTGRSSDAARSRDEDMKPGQPPRPSTEPKGAKGSSRSPKTRTDPATGEPRSSPPQPN
jgi:hypothetical protein